MISESIGGHRNDFQSWNRMNYKDCSFEQIMVKVGDDTSSEETTDPLAIKVKLNNGKELVQCTAITCLQSKLLAVVYSPPQLQEILQMVSANLSFVRLKEN